MEPLRWRRARALFDQLVDTPVEQWRPRLAELCPDDPGVREEALALLHGDLAATGPTGLGAQAPEVLAGLAAVDEAAWQGRLVGQRVGPYVLVRELGRGGMGAVWLAERADGEFAQQVAVKLIRPGWDAEDLLARFRAERQILASLTHPNIAHLLDGGVTEDGKPWLALELVDGVDLRAYCAARRLDLAARLRLFLGVCEPVAHAHSRLVVHRDLKPSNVMVTAAGQVKLLDFGIARLVDPARGEASLVRVFTPDYAAPEQVRGELPTTAVDVYALGLLLYELLTGRRPYGVEGSTPAAYERAILDQDPTRPSDAVTRETTAGAAAVLAAERRLTPARLERALRGDLDAIVLKALRKEPAARYASVAELAADVVCYLEQRPVSAHRGGWRYRSGRFLRRHALAASLVTLAVLAVAGGTSLAVWQAREADRQRDAAVAETAKTRAVLDFMHGLFELADPAEARGRQVTARELLDRGSERMRGAFEDQPAVRAELLSAMADARRGLGLYAEALPVAAEASALARACGEDRLARVADLRRAVILHELGRYSEALALLDQLRAAASTTDDEAVGYRADVELRRALALQALNRLDEAAAAYDAALTAQRRLYGENDRRTLATALRQVALLVLRGDDAAATTAARTVLERVRATTPADDPLRADALGTLAMVLSNTGPAAEAVALRREELALAERIFGPDHPRTVSAANNLASALYAERRFPEAAALYTRILPLRRQQLGADHPAVATVANNLAWCEIELGRPQAARELAADALRIRLASYGPNHHTVANSLRVLGSIAIEQGQLAVADDYLRRAVATMAAAVGADNRLGLGFLNDLARVELLRGRPAPGCATVERSWRIYADAPPVGAPETAYYQGLRAACWVAIRRRAEGEPLLASSLATMVEHWGKLDRRTRIVQAVADAVRRQAR